MLTAHEEGRLVIFTGAGISMDPPSDLPSFPGLAGTISRKLNLGDDPESSDFLTPLDAYLGELNERDDVDVHRLVKGIVTASTSSPNANHQSLGRIATQGTVRVVTTNYDLHLETTLREHDGNLEVFHAPALPMGDNFDGLVYLHGSAAGPADRLVVTDRDFSGAYFQARGQHGSSSGCSASTSSCSLATATPMWS